jgi:predicted transcriptional regulator
VERLVDRGLITRDATTYSLTPLGQQSSESERV